MSVVLFILSDEVKATAKRLFPGSANKVILFMLRRAAIVTHPKGNRRFEDYIFRVDGMQVQSLGSMSGSLYIGDPLCTLCGGVGRTTVYQECEHCEGDGCVDCSREGAAMSFIKCQSCKGKSDGEQGKGRQQDRGWKSHHNVRSGNRGGVRGSVSQQAKKRTGNKRGSVGNSKNGNGNR